MKKWSALLLCFMIITLPLASFASDQNYTIDYLNLSASIPDTYQVALYPVKAADPILDTLGISVTEFNTYMEDGQIYLDALSQDFSKEIIIYSRNLEPGEESKATIDTMRQYAADALTGSNREQFMSLVEQAGFQATDLTIYDHQQTKFIYSNLYGSLDGVDVYSDIYFTYHDGKAVNVAVKSYGQPIDEASRADGKRIVDSMVFYGTDGSPAVPTAAGPSVDRFATGAAKAFIFILVFAFARWIIGRFKKSEVSK